MCQQLAKLWDTRAPEWAPACSIHLQLDNSDCHWSDPSEGLLCLSQQGGAKGKAGGLTAAAQNKHYFSYCNIKYKDVQLSWESQWMYWRLFKLADAKLFSSRGPIPSSHVYSTSKLNHTKSQALTHILVTWFSLTHRFHMALKRHTNSHLKYNNLHLPVNSLHLSEQKSNDQTPGSSVKSLWTGNNLLISPKHLPPHAYCSTPYFILFSALNHSYTHLCSLALQLIWIYQPNQQHHSTQKFTSPLWKCSVPCNTKK